MDAQRTAPLGGAALGLILLLWACFAPAATAAEAPVVTYAGIAYTGSHADIERRLPVTSAALASYGTVRANQALLAALQRRPPAHFTIDATSLAALDGSGSAVVLALSLDRETVTSERIDGRWKVLFEIAAQALFFDFREKQVLFSYPITVQYIDLLDQAPTDADIARMANQLVTGDGPSSLRTVVPAELATLALPEASARRLQVTEVSLATGSAAKLPDRQRDAATIGHEFTKVLASTLRLPMLPHAKGHALGNAMSTRFADGVVFDLRIPDPDYRIVVQVDDFREKTLSQSAGFRQQLYGAFFRVRIEEPLSSTVYFDQPLRQGSTKAIPASQDVVDSAASYYETLIAGFSSFASATQGGARPWAKEQTGGRVFAAQLQSLNELVNQCR